MAESTNDPLSALLQEAAGTHHRVYLVQLDRDYASAPSNETRPKFCARQVKLSLGSA